MGSWGGPRPGAGRKRKTLLQRIEDGSFSTEHHSHLLKTDDSLLEVEIAPDHPDRDRLERLMQLQLLFRSLRPHDSFARRLALRRFREELDR